MLHPLELVEVMSTLFWNMIEPVEGKFDWSQSDILMGLNEKNNLKVTLFFSIINGDSLGPFPTWIGNPTLITGINEDELVNTLDEYSFTISCSGFNCYCW